MQGAIGHSGDQVLGAIISCLHRQGIHLERVGSAAVLGENEWQSVDCYTTGKPSGTLRVALRSAAQLKEVKDILHEKAIQLGSDLVALAVVDDESAVAQAKNARRGARPRARASAASPPAAPGTPQV